RICNWIVPVNGSGAAQNIDIRAIIDRRWSRQSHRQGGNRSPRCSIEFIGIGNRYVVRGCTAEGVKIATDTGYRVVSNRDRKRGTGTPDAEAWSGSRYRSWSRSWSKRRTGRGG